VSPALRFRVRNALIAAEFAATPDKPDIAAHYRALVEEMDGGAEAEVMAGGDMPEPDAGMRVTLPNGSRRIVEGADPTFTTKGWTVRLHPLPGSAWGSDAWIDWTPENIREVRAHDGRVLWRRAP
jgi:hypothetical protein